MHVLKRLVKSFFIAVGLAIAAIVVIAAALALIAGLMWVVRFYPIAVGIGLLFVCLWSAAYNYLKATGR